jgi:hypothetical protein
VGEVGQVGERLAGDDPGHLGLGDAFDVGEGHPDAVPPPIRQIRVPVLAGFAAGSRYSTVSRRWRNTSTRQGVRQALHGIPTFAGVDVQAEDLDTQRAGVVEDEPLGIHPGVVGEHPGEEGRRMVGLEPSRLIGRQRERRRMRLAEAERREGAQHLPDPVGVGHRITPGERGRAPPGLDIELTLR